MLKQRELDLGIMREYYKEVKKFFDEKMIVPEEICNCGQVVGTFEKIKANTYEEFHFAIDGYIVIRNLEEDCSVLAYGTRVTAEAENYENYELGLYARKRQREQTWSRNIQEELEEKKKKLPKIKRTAIGDFKFEDEFTNDLIQQFMELYTDLTPEDLGGLGKYYLDDIKKLKEQLEEAMKIEGNYFKTKMLVGDYAENIDMSKIIVL